MLAQNNNNSCTFLNGPHQQPYSLLLQHQFQNLQLFSSKKKNRIHIIYILYVHTSLQLFNYQS